MTLSTIRTLVTDFGTYLDNYRGDSPTAAELVAQINWGIRVFARRWHLLDNRITFTISNPIASTNGAKFNIRDTTTPVVSKRVVLPYVVYIGGQPLYDWNGNPGLWSISQLDQRVSGWQTESSNTPYRAAYLGNGKLLLSPPPATAGSNNFIAGTYLPADLTNGTDDAASPDLPDELHEALAYFVAQHVALPTATEQEQWEKLKVYNQEWMSLVTEIATENRNAIEGPWTDSGWKYGKAMRV